MFLREEKPHEYLNKSGARYAILYQTIRLKKLWWDSEFSMLTKNLPNIHLTLPKDKVRWIKLFQSQNNIFFIRGRC